MDEISFWTYPLVFLSVLIPYLAASLWLGTPRKAATRGGASSLPLFYRVSARFIEAISLALGDAFTEDFPALAKSYRNTVLKSGWNLTETDVLAGQVFGACAGAVFLCFGFFLASAQAPLAVGLGCVGAFLGWVYPLMLVQKRADERQTEIIRALPFAIDLIASAMRAGLDFSAAVRYYVGAGGKGALAVEFGLLLRQMEFGKSRMEALGEMATHVQTQEFSAFVGAVAHGTEIGASIVETLRIQGEDMRRARFNIAERKAARAPSIMIFPIAVFILPAVFTIIGVPVWLKFKASRGGL